MNHVENVAAGNRIGVVEAELALVGQGRGRQGGCGYALRRRCSVAGSQGAFTRTRQAALFNPTRSSVQDVAGKVPVLPVNTSESDRRSRARLATRAPSIPIAPISLSTSSSACPLGQQGSGFAFGILVFTWLSGRSALTGTLSRTGSRCASCRYAWLYDGLWQAVTDDDGPVGMGTRCRCGRHGRPQASPLRGRSPRTCRTPSRAGTDAGAFRLCQNRAGTDWGWLR